MARNNRMSTHEWREIEQRLTPEQGRRFDVLGQGDRSHFKPFDMEKARRRIALDRIRSK